MKQLIRSFLVFVLVVAGMNTAHALKLNNVARIEIIDPAEFRESSSLGFSNIEKPESGEISVTVAPDGSSSKKYKEFVSKGEYSIAGSRGNAIQIDVKSDENNIEGINLSKFVALYNNSRITLPAIGQQASVRSSSLSLGTTLTVSSQAKSGLYSPRFEVAVYYE